MQKGTNRGMYFGLVCYTKEMVNLITSHTDILYYAYIFHDKDLKNDGDSAVPHYHILVKLCKQQREGWFKRFESVDRQNVMTRSLSNPYGYYKYLTHSNDDSIRKGKYQYDASLIVSTFDYDLSTEKADNLSAEALELEQLFNDIQLVSKGLMRLTELNKKYNYKYAWKYTQLKGWVSEFKEERLQARLSNIRDIDNEFHNNERKATLTPVYACHQSSIDDCSDLTCENCPACNNNELPFN